MKVNWTPQAREDLITLHWYIALENPRAADKIYDKIERKTDLLNIFPHIGQRCPDIGPKTRLLIETPYLIFYEAREDEVEILRVIDGRRDIIKA